MAENRLNRIGQDVLDALSQARSVNQSGDDADDFVSGVTRNFRSSSSSTSSTQRQRRRSRQRLSQEHSGILGSRQWVD